MYIISKFKDYYDGVAGSMGIDKSIVFERHSVEIKKNNEMLKEFQLSRNREMRGNPFTNIAYAHIDSKKTKKYDRSNYFIIGFCGKLYLGWRLISEEPYYKSGIKLMKSNTEYVYGYENVKDIITDYYYKSNIVSDIEYIMNYNPINMFRSVNSPIFVYDLNGAFGTRYHPNPSQIINPVLNDYQFYKVFDSYQAFQEISMFIGGVLGSNENNIIEVDDKYKIGKYGFDKWSFRKEPKNK